MLAKTSSFRRWRSRLLAALAAGMACLTTGATVPSPTPLTPTAHQLADIIIQGPIIVIPRGRDVERGIERDVTVQFVAQGDDWATIYLDNRILFRAANTRRTYTVTLEPGVYELQITGVSRFDVWDSGLLTVGRDDIRAIVIRYGKDTGIRVAGDPYAWIPD